MEPGDNTLIILVHGVSANYNEISEKKTGGGNVCPRIDEGRPSNLFDQNAHARGVSFGDLKGFLDHDLGLKGQVYYYNFQNPAEMHKLRNVLVMH